MTLYLPLRRLRGKRRRLRKKTFQVSVVNESMMAQGSTDRRCSRECGRTSGPCTESASDRGSPATHSQGSCSDSMTSRSSSRTCLARTCTCCWAEVASTAPRSRRRRRLHSRGGSRTRACATRTHRKRNGTGCCCRRSHLHDDAKGSRSKEINKLNVVFLGE